MENNDATSVLTDSAEVMQIKTAAKSGAHWFYWIAALSLINSVAQLFGSQWSFTIGLGITQVIDGLAAAASAEATGEGTAVIHAITIAIDLFAVASFSLLGWFAVKRHTWAFLVGMLLYGLDSVFFILAEDWFGIGFHAFALVGIFSGYAALRKLRGLTGMDPATDTNPKLAARNKFMDELQTIPVICPSCSFTKKMPSASVPEKPHRYRVICPKCNTKFRLQPV